MRPIAGADVVLVMAGFARALREAGVAADRARVTASMDALSRLNPADPAHVYWAARLTLCSEPDDFPRFDALFALWFQGEALSLAGRPSAASLDVAPRAGMGGTGDAEADAREPDDVLAVAAAETEVLRQRDIAALTGPERAEVHRLIALLRPRMPRRRTARYAPGGRRRVDVGRTVRTMLRGGGEPAAVVRQRRRVKDRRLVFLLDVSGSMEPYAEALIRFAHAAVRVAPRTTEAFTVGTRLTRITRPLRLRDPDLALRAAGTAVPDWSGGTRLGESLQVFLDRWGQRGTARGAAVIIASDGWERGDAALLGEQMRRLSYLAHRVIWINPHRGKDGYAPVTAGMVAALPAIDDLIAGHTLEAIEQAVDLLARW